jgi:hypothetical protein
LITSCSSILVPKPKQNAVVKRRRKHLKKENIQQIERKTIIVEKLCTGVSIHFFSSLSHLDFKLEIPTSKFEIRMRRLLRLLDPHDDSIGASSSVVIVSKMQPTNA